MQAFNAAEITALAHFYRVKVYRPTVGHALGLSVRIYNPALDPDGSAGRVLANTLAQALASEDG